MPRSKLTVITLLFFALPAPQALSDGEKYGANLLPHEIQQRMLSGKGNLTSWHIRQEVWNILTMAAVMAGTHALAKKTPSWLPLGHLTTAAGIALDFRTSHTWAEFFLRQLALFPLLALKQIPNSVVAGDGLSPLEEIATEIPSILLSLYEIGEQRRLAFHGVTKIRLSHNSPADLPPIYLSTAPSPILTFYPPLLGSPNCPDQAQTDGLHHSLQLMICEACKKHFTSISFFPRRDAQSASLKVIIRGDEGYRQLVIEQDHNNTPWVTDILTSNRTVHNTSVALNPLSESTIQQVSAFIAGDLSTDHMTMTTNKGNYSKVLGGDYLQAITLGSKGFLLIDHSLSQGTQTPDIWINTTAPAESITQEWIDGIEDRMIPSGGKGLWRLSSVLKSALYRLAMKYGLSWLNDLSTGTDNGTQEPATPCPFDPEQLTTRDIITQNNQIRDHLEHAKKQISQTPGKVIVLLDDRTPHTARRRTQFAQLKEPYDSFTILRDAISTDPVATQRVSRGRHVQRIVNINPHFLEGDNLKGVKQIQEEWIKRANKVLAVIDNNNLQNINNENPECHSRALKWLRDISARTTPLQSTPNKAYLFYSDLPTRSLNSATHQALPNSWRCDTSESALLIWIGDGTLWKQKLHDFMTR